MRVMGIGLQNLELLTVTLDRCHTSQTKRTEICIKRIDGIAKVVCMDSGGDELRSNFLQLAWC